MASITTRAGKGTPLTNAEVDANFTNLNTELATKVDQAGARAAISVTGSGSYNSTTGVITVTGGVVSVAGKTGAVTLTDADVGLGSVENKSSATIRSELTSGNVTGALGFTPYNSTNPSGFISGINSSMVTGALGYTPYSSSNPSGYITSSALSSYLPLSGGSLTGVLDINNSAAAPSGGNSLTLGKGVGYKYIQSWASEPLNFNPLGNAVQVAGNVVLHAGNYTSYSPSLTGGSASGTWGISITGSAAQLGGYTSSSYSGPSSVVKQFFWNDLFASGTQARTFEIARLAIDFNDWNGGSGPFEVELYESYFSRGLKKKYVIYWGYTNSAGIQLVEYSGSGDNNFQCRIGTPVQVSGDHYYLPVFVDVRYYTGVDVGVTTNRDITTSNPPGIAQTYINASPSATNISDFTADSTVNFASTTAVQINGNQLLHAGNYASYALPLSGGTVTGSVAVNSDVTVGNNGAAYAYTAAANGKLYFGSSGADAPSSYHIGTVMEDYGGNYSKLDFRWYTGQRFYSHYGYGGFRFKEITTGSTLFSVGEGDLNTRVANNLYIGGNTALHAGNYTSYTLPISGGWYGSGLPGTRWAGLTSNGGEIAFGTNLPNLGQMGILIDGCYVAGENNGYWSLGNDNSWGSRRGFYWDGSQLNFTTNSPNAAFSRVVVGSGQTSSWLDMVDTDEGTRYLHNNGGSIGFVGNDGNWNLRSTDDGNFWLRNRGWFDSIVLRKDTNQTMFAGQTSALSFENQSSFFRFAFNDLRFYDWNTGTDIFGLDEHAWSSSSMRAPIFYDRDNTGYYLDPAGYSYVNSLRATSYLASNGNIYTDANFGYGHVGLYSSYRYQGVFAMADAYKLPADGTTTGNLYGIAWSHPNAGGTASNLSTHGALILENGGFLAALSGSIRSRDDMRTPIFYDSNDTSYYVDPNSNSRLVNLGLGGVTPDTRLSVNGDSHFSGYMHMGGTAGSLNSWGSRDYASGSTRYFNAAGYEFNNAGYGSTWSVTLASGNAQASSSVRAPVFYDSNDTSYYFDPTSQSWISSLSVNVGNESTGAANSSSSGLVLRGNYNSNSWAHKFHKYDNGNGVPLYLSQTVGAGSWSALQGWGNGTGYTTRVYGSVASDTEYTATLYDINDTGYYVDANNTSSLNTVQAYRFATQQGSVSPDNSHPGYGLRPFYSWNIGSAYNSGGGYSNGITIGSNPGDQAYGWQIVQNMWDDATYTRRYNSGWQSWRKLQWVNDWMGSSLVHEDGRHYATILYDSSDSSYYCDPNGTSRLNVLNTAGAITASGNVTAYSDERLKKDWTDLPEDFVDRLAHVLSGTYTRTDIDERQAGVSAQSLEKLLAEVVSQDSQGIKAVAYGNAAMVSAVALAKRVVSQEQRLARLESLVEQLIGDSK